MLSSLLYLSYVFFFRLKEEGANSDEVKTPKKLGLKPKNKIKFDENGRLIEPNPKRLVELQ